MRATPNSEADAKMKISVIVIVYDMPRQAMNTLYSLSTQHQKNVSTDDYEVVVVENQSNNNLIKEDVLALGINFRYFLRHEESSSPVSALNFGVAQSKAPMLCLMIDGARMVTPRIIEYALHAKAISVNSIVAVPGYNLGPAEQHFNHDYQYADATEIELLASTHWQDNGYRLFDIANLSGANPKGPVQLFWECNCLFASRHVWDAVGGADSRFTLPGGGSINLHLYRLLGEHSAAQYYFVMPGEGSFHQYHGGVTTSQKKDRTELLEQFRTQLESIWHGEFPGAIKREPLLIGAVNSHAQRFLQISSTSAFQRFEKLQAKRMPAWPDDAAFLRVTEFSG